MTVTEALNLLNSPRYVGRSAGPPDSLPALLAVHAAAALEVSGADQTAWNGQVVEAGEGILGLAHWDGTLHLDRECILEPLRDMYARAERPPDEAAPDHALSGATPSGGVPRDEAVLLRWRDALVTLLHEQSHFLGPSGATQEAARLAFRLPGARALEEGVAEGWAQDHLNDYIRHLGVNKVAPGICQLRSRPSYQAFVPAVRVLTTHLDKQADLPRGSTLAALNRRTAEGQWPLIIDSAYRASRLPDLVPPTHEPAVRLRLETTLRESFDTLADLETLPRDLAATKSLAIGHRTTHRLSTEITTIEAIFEPHPVTTAEQAAARAAPDSPTTLPYRKALSGIAPPTPTPAHTSPHGTTGGPPRPPRHFVTATQPQRA